MVNYPKQIFCVWGKNTSLDAACELQTPRKESNVSPLELHEANLSRFVLTILDRASGSPVAHTANVPAWDIPIIKEMTHFALQKKLDAGEQNDEGKEEPAYTTKIPFGKFQNRTPAEILLSNDDATEELKKTASFLQKNVEKYPANQAVIDAINQAITLFEIGELSTPTTKSGMMVYERNFKRQRNPGEDGLYKMFNISIRCNFGMNYPWEVNILNGRVGLTEKKGTMVPDLKTMKDRKSAVIQLSDADWIACVDKLYSVCKLFENMNFQEMYNRSMDMAKQQIEQYKAEHIA